MRCLLLFVMLAGCGDDVMQVSVDAPGGEAVLVAMPTTIDFGDTGAGDPATPAKLITIVNTGGSTSGPLHTQLTSTDASSFHFMSDGCNGGRIAALGTCEIMLQFRPPLADGIAHANLLVGAAPGGDATIALTGNAVPDPRARIEANTVTHNFGDEAIATTSVPNVFTLTNPGTSPTGPITVQMAGPNPTAFGVVTGCAAPLPPGGTCTATTAFRPTALETYAAEVHVTASPGGGVVLVLMGAGVDVRLVPSTPAIDFGNVPINTLAGPQTYMVTNTATHASQGVNTTASGPEASEFRIDLNGCPAGNALAAGASCTLGVSFMPLTPGPHTATITTFANGSLASVTVTGTGI